MSDPKPLSKAEIAAKPVWRYYAEDDVVRVEDFGQIERAWAEAEHEDCEDQPPGHPLTEHSPWSGGDLDGVETWESFTARLARHGLILATLDQSGRSDGLRRNDVIVAVASVLRTFAPDIGSTDRATLSEAIADAALATPSSAPDVGEDDEPAPTKAAALLEHVTKAFDEYLWGLSCSPGGEACEESVRYFRGVLLSELAALAAVPEPPATDR